MGCPIRTRQCPFPHALLSCTRATIHRGKGPTPAIPYPGGVGFPPQYTTGAPRIGVPLVSSPVGGLHICIYIARVRIRPRSPTLDGKWKLLLLLCCSPTIRRIRHHSFMIELDAPLDPKKSRLQTQLTASRSILGQTDTVRAKNIRQL